MKRFSDTFFILIPSLLNCIKTHLFTLSLSLSLLFVDTPLQYIYINTCIILYISLFSMHLLKFSLSLILSFNESLFGFLRDDKRIYSV